MCHQIYNEKNPDLLLGYSRQCIPVYNFNLIMRSRKRSKPTQKLKLKDILQNNWP